MKSKEEERITHEAYGQISFSRVNGRARFYGSELEQDNYISMDVHTSEIERTLTQDRYYNKKKILRLRMSAMQFSELITTLNYGAGVPCTLEMYDGKITEKIEKQESRKEFVHRKFGERMKDFANSLEADRKEALDIIKKKTLSKNDQQRLSNKINFINTEVASNIPFFAECFQEVMDEVVNEAKLEAENAIQHKISTLGLGELKKDSNLLNK